VTFHPDVALQAMEEVKRRRQDRVTAAAEVKRVSTIPSAQHIGTNQVEVAPPAALLLNASTNSSLLVQALCNAVHVCFHEEKLWKLTVVLLLQTLASVAAMQQDAPAFRNREGNFAADAVDDVASDAALQLPSGDGDAAADDADDGQVLHFATRALSSRYRISPGCMCWRTGCPDHLATINPSLCNVAHQCHVHAGICSGCMHGRSLPGTAHRVLSRWMAVRRRRLARYCCVWRCRGRATPGAYSRSGWCSATSI